LTVVNYIMILPTVHFVLIADFGKPLKDFHRRKDEEKSGISPEVAISSYEIPK
jgi:hypothetical protein